MPWIVEMCTHVAPKLNASSWLVHFHENHHENHQKNLLQWIQHDEAYFSQQNARHRAPWCRPWTGADDSNGGLGQFVR